MGLFRSLRANLQPTQPPNEAPKESSGSQIQAKELPPSYQKTSPSDNYRSVEQNSSRSMTEPPPYHDWTVVPDAALLPPPPALGNETSPTGNAERSEAERAHRWCVRYPLMQPRLPSSSQTDAVRLGRVSLQRPQEYTGTISELSPGAFRCSTTPENKDCCLMTSLPLYFASANSPHDTKTTRTIYFELKIASFGKSTFGDQSALAIGFCGVPYPTWRMPGWERGSLGVHSDDGRRYINDTNGGIDFTDPFRAGETIGFGMAFSLPERGSTFLAGEVFLTRNGKKVGGWNVEEEVDSESEFGKTGIDGRYDLFGAVGVFGQVSFDVTFNSQDWFWKP